jgi:hypothetical protein
MTAPDVSVQPFFSWRSLDVEIAARLNSDGMPVAELVRRLHEKANVLGVAGADLERVRELCTALDRCNLDRTYPGYQRHPIRVTAAFLAEVNKPGHLSAALALCHNVRELDLAEYEAVAREFVPSDAQPCLDLLNTDRERERDKLYLKDYYDAIAAAPFDLLVLKGFDKLDNFLEYATTGIEPWHVEIVLEFLEPRLRSRHDRLARYLGRLGSFLIDPQAHSAHRTGSCP